MAKLYGLRCSAVQQYATFTFAFRLRAGCEESKQNEGPADNIPRLAGNTTCPRSRYINTLPHKSLYNRNNALYMKLSGDQEAFQWQPNGMSPIEPRSYWWVYLSKSSRYCMLHYNGSMSEILFCSFYLLNRSDRCIKR
jgi:hypothetical protein